MVFLLISNLVQAQIVKEVVIHNNEKTKSWIILRELLIKAGDTIQSDMALKLKRSQENLYNTRLFNEVRVIDTVINNSTVIFVDVQERWYFWPYLILEHADRNLATFIRSEEWDRINYGVMLIKHNFRGRKEDLGFKFRLGFRQQFGLNYFIPMINKNRQRLGLFFDVSLFRQKSFFYNIQDFRYQYYDFGHYGYIEERFKGGLVFRPSHNIQHYIVATTHHFNVNDTLPQINRSLFGKETTTNDWFLFDYVFEHTTLDYIKYPTSGHSFLFSLAVGTDFQENRWENMQTNYQVHFPLQNRLTYSTAVFGEYFFENPPPVGLRRSIGNNYYFRGYEDDVWHARGSLGNRQQLSWNFLRKRKFHIQNISAKKFNKPFVSLYATAFSDIGVVGGVPPGHRNIFLMSAGTGIDLVSYYDLVFRFESVVNLDKKYWFNIHMGTVF
jgi:outer membrane protein assembly factor BamA